MHSVLHETVRLNSGLNRLNDQNHLLNCLNIREHIFSLIISIYQAGLTADRSRKANHLYRALMYLDRIEFDLKSLDVPDCWRDFDNILREVSYLRNQVNSYLYEVL
jgi:hypothetical protein